MQQSALLTLSDLRLSTRLVHISSSTKYNVRECHFEHKLYWCTRVKSAKQHRPATCECSIKHSVKVRLPCARNTSSITCFCKAISVLSKDVSTHLRYGGNPVYPSSCKYQQLPASHNVGTFFVYNRWFSFLLNLKGRVCGDSIVIPGSQDE